MTDITQFKIKPINLEELKVIIDDPSLLGKLGYTSVDDITDLTSPAYSIQLGKYKIAFLYWESEQGTNVYDIHILCPKDSIRASRVLSLAIASWMFNNPKLKVKALVADCPEGSKLANMARKLGGYEYKREKGKVYFILPSPYLKQKV